MLCEGWVGLGQGGLLDRLQRLGGGAVAVVGKVAMGRLRSVASACAGWREGCGGGCGCGYRARAVAQWRRSREGARAS